MLVVFYLQALFSEGALSTRIKRFCLENYSARMLECDYAYRILPKWLLHCNYKQKLRAKLVVSAWYTPQYSHDCELMDAVGFTKLAEVFSHWHLFGEATRTVSRQVNVNFSTQLND